MKEISKILKPVVTLILLSSLTACINDEDPKPPEVLTGSEVNIEGDWKTSCRYNPDNDIWVISSFKFVKDKFTYKQYLYSDDSCTQLKDSNTFPGKITYHGNESRKATLGTAYEKDLLFDDGEEWKSLVALEDNDNTLYIAPGYQSTPRPDDINSRNSIKFTEGTVDPPEEHVDIDGTWKTDCAYFEDEKIGIEFIFKVSGDRFSFRTNGYSDNSCTQSKSSGLDAGKVTYGKKITTPSGLTAHEIDLQFNKDGYLWAGSLWKSLVTKQGNKLSLNPDLEGTGRPTDLRGATEFSKQ